MRTPSRRLEVDSNLETHQEDIATAASSTNTALLPQVLTRQDISSLITGLDASDVLECYYLTRTTVLHGLANSTVPLTKAALGIRHVPQKQSPQSQRRVYLPSLTLEYGPARVGADWQHESIPTLFSSDDGDFDSSRSVQWTNEAKVYYQRAPTIDSNLYPTANYLTSMSGAVLESLLNEAVDYAEIHRRRYQPLTVLRHADNEQDANSDATSPGSSPDSSSSSETPPLPRVMLHASSDTDFLWYMYEHLATLGVELAPLVKPPADIQLQLHATSINRVKPGIDVALGTLATFYDRLGACLQALATADYTAYQPSDTQVPSIAPSVANNKEGDDSEGGEGTSGDEPTDDQSGNDQQDDDDEDNDPDNGENDDEATEPPRRRRQLNKKSKSKHNGGDDAGDGQAGDGQDGDGQDGDGEDGDGQDGDGEDDGGDTQTKNTKGLVDDQEETSPSSSAPTVSPLTSTPLSPAVSSSGIPSIAPTLRSTSLSGSPSASPKPFSPVTYRPTQAPVDHSAAAAEAAAEAQEAADMAGAAGNHEAAQAAQKAADAAQQAADSTASQAAQIARDAILSGDGRIALNQVSTCFKDPLYGLATVDSNATTVYLYWDGSVYYQVELVAPYLTISTLTQDLPQPPIPSAFSKGDLVDWSLALLLIGMVWLGGIMLLQQVLGRSLRIIRPLYKLQRWFFDPRHFKYDLSGDDDDDVLNFGAGHEYTFGEDVIPLSMGGRRALTRTYSDDPSSDHHAVMVESGGRNGSDSISDGIGGDVELMPTRARTESYSNGNGVDEIHISDDPGIWMIARDTVAMPNLSSSSKVAVPVTMTSSNSSLVDAE